MSSNERLSEVVDGVNQEADNGSQDNVAEHKMMRDIPLVFHRLIGEISVTNLPIGKEITLNTPAWGDLKVTTATGDFKKQHKPGTYMLTVNTDGYEVFHDKVTVAGGKTTTVAVLKSQPLNILPGDLLITNLPVGKEIILNTPIWRDLEIHPDSTRTFRHWHASGTFSLIVKSDGYEVFHDIVAVAIGKTATVTIPVGTASLGGRVWHDKHYNGIQDIDDVGIPNVQADLLNFRGDVIGVTLTNELGNYQFTRLSPGDYRVRFIKPKIKRGEVSFSLKNKGGDIKLDSDADKATGMTDIITLKSGENKLYIDAGMCYPMIPLDATWYKGEISFINIPKDRNISIKLLNLGDNTPSGTEQPFSGSERFKMHPMVKEDGTMFNLIVKIDDEELKGNIFVTTQGVEVDILKCLVLGMKFKFCAEFEGNCFKIALDFQNYSELTWKGSLITEELQSVPIVVEDGLKLNLNAEYNGKNYGFTMNHDKDAIWKMDVSTFRELC